MTDDPSDLEQTPAEVLRQAVQAFVNERAGEPTLIQSGVIVYETVTYSDNGRVLHEINYSALPGTSMSGSVGLLDLGREKVVTDIGVRDPDESD